MLVTIFGSCRQESLYKIPWIKVTGIQNNISFTHNTKEILEVIQFCKEGHVSPEETITTFRTPILRKCQLYFNNSLKNNFNNTKLFVLEIASRKTYEFNGKCVHHILFDDNEFKNKITVSTQSDEEIEDNIIQIQQELNHRPMIIVGHIVTYHQGSRHDLLTLLEHVCEKQNILFIHPKKEIENLGLNVNTFLEKDLTHFNKAGHAIMQNIYNKKMVELLKNK